MDLKNDFTFEDLTTAYKECRKHKRNTLNALEFEFNLEENLLDLYNELKTGNYQIGKSICFMVLHPKPREVWAASFRDRVVHHLVYNAIKDRFYNRFISDTFSCIPERGTLNACRKTAKYAKSITRDYTRDAYYMKADLKNFFVSIDKDILMQELERYVQEEWILKLLRQIIYHDPRTNVEIRSNKWKFDLLPTYKSLWYCDSSKGLPIGNLTSQFFSNVYLNVLDQYVKHHLKCRYYCRYVDDFVMMSTDPKQLNEWHRDLTVFLKERLKLDLHQNKKEINKVERGIDFVGFIIKHGRIQPRQRTLKRVFKLAKNYRQSNTWFEKEDLLTFRASMNSYLGMLRAVSCFNLRKEICLECRNLFVGCDKDFTRMEIKTL